MLKLAEVCALPIGQKCLYVIADKRSGFSLELGDPVRLETPTDNSELAELQRNHRGETSLTIYCNWSATKGGRDLLGWEQSERFVGRTITCIQFLNKALDFRVEFDDDLTLFVLTDPELLAFQYSWRFSDRFWSVGATGVSDSAD